jgi:hypothetical protein
MADIAAVPFINYGLSQAQQMDAQSAAALKSQQAAAAGMENQITAASLPYVIKTMKDYMTESSNNTGVASGAPTVDGGGPIGQQQRDREANNGLTTAEITSANASRYYVNPWEQNELQMLGPASAMQMVGRPGMMQALQARRQARLDQINAQNQYEANKRYEAFGSVGVPEGGDPSGAYSRLGALRSDPMARTIYDYIGNKYQGDGAAQVAARDRAASDFANFQASDLHPYTNRGTEQRTDGVTVDAKDRRPVPGVPTAGMDPKARAEIVEKALTPSIEVQTGVPGQTHKISPVEAVMGTGSRDVDGYLKKIANGSALTPDKLNALSAGKIFSAQDVAGLRTPPTSAERNTQLQSNQQELRNAKPDGKTRTLPAPPPPANVMDGQTPRPKAGVTPQVAPTTAAPNTPAAVNTPTKFNPGSGLDTIDPSSLPKFAQPVNPQNYSASTQQSTDITNYNKMKFEDQNAARQANVQNANQRSLLDQADKELEQLRKDPRMIGPGSGITMDMEKFMSFVNTGQAPKGLVARTMLDKILLQLGAANVRLATQGMGGRVGQQEFMKILTEGNPTGHMALKAVQELVNFTRYNNEFDTRANNTRMAALRSGADPSAPAYAGIESGRSDYIQRHLTQRAIDGTDYRTPQDVGEAMRDGDLTRDQAKHILETQYAGKF